MPRLELTKSDATRLDKVLRSYLGDLRMEIANTDSKDFREDLKDEEEIIKKILASLVTH